MAIIYRGERFAGYNKPKRTPKHPKKSHAVLAKEGDTVRLIRFGQQGVRGAGKNPKTAKDKARKKSYYARHNAQGKPTSKLSAKYWSHKVKWQEKEMPNVDGKKYPYTKAGMAAAKKAKGKSFQTCSMCKSPRACTKAGRCLKGVSA